MLASRLLSENVNRRDSSEKHTVKQRRKRSSFRPGCRAPRRLWRPCLFQRLSISALNLTDYEKISAACRRMGIDNLDLRAELMQYFGQVKKNDLKFIDDEHPLDFGKENGVVCLSHHLPNICNKYFMRSICGTATLEHARSGSMPTKEAVASSAFSRKLRQMETRRSAPPADKAPRVDIHVTQIITPILQQGAEYPFAQVRNNLPKRKRIVIDYSSPNIAKPFHTGHWRSTILGNFIANLNERCGHTVERINYLGDWGTQFGILAAGFERFGSEEELSHAKLDHLLDVYAKANTEAEASEEFKNACTEQQSRLENGSDERARFLWQNFRTLSLDYYTDMYEKLGMSPFQHIHFESSYAESSKSLAKEITSQVPSENASDEATSSQYCVTLAENSSPIRLLKSDGSSLYLSRDVAALKDRAEKFDFDTIYYVVDYAQSNHFENLFRIAEQYVPILRGRDMQHIKFGRVHGMSTRKGDVIKLDDVIKDASAIALDRINASRFARPDDPKHAAHYCALAAMLVNDLKQRRMNDYEYQPNKFLQFEGDTGMTLQYLHARLCSLERMAKQQQDLVPKTDALFGAIIEFDGVKLVERLAQCQEAVRLAYEELEPLHIVQYLFKLRGAANRALPVLRVLGEREDVATARLSMFHATRIIVNVLLKTLGVRTLDRM